VNRSASSIQSHPVTGHPAPCNFKYLGGGCTNKVPFHHVSVHNSYVEYPQNCPFGHDYDLPEEELEAMRQTALKAPCRYANEGNTSNCNEYNLLNIFKINLALIINVIWAINVLVGHDVNSMQKDSASSPEVRYYSVKEILSDPFSEDMHI
jgi:hypothetical protein